MTTAKRKAATTRTTFTLRLTDAEVARARALAEHHGVDVTNMLRVLMTREARAVGLEPSRGGAP